MSSAFQQGLAHAERRVYSQSYQDGVLEKLFALADANMDDELTAEELIGCREHPQFGGSAAFHHAQDWIKRLVETMEMIDPDKMAKTMEQEKQPKRPKKPKKRKKASVDKSEL